MGYEDIVYGQGVLDAELFERYVAAIHLPRGDRLSLTGLVEIPDEQRDDQKAKFLAGKIRNPSFSYPRIDRAELTAVLVQLSSLWPLINDAHPAIRAVYTAAVDEAISHIMLLLQSSVASELSGLVLSGRDADRREDAMQRFRAHVLKLFGLPRFDVTDYAVDHFYDKALVLSDDKDQQKSDTAAQLVRQLGDFAFDIKEEVKPPSRQSFETVQDAILRRRGRLLKLSDEYWLVDGEPKTKLACSRPQMKAAFERQLQVEKLDQLGWQVVNDDTDKLVVTAATAERKLFLPPRFALTRQRVIELSLHELDHANRAETGRASGIRLSGFGLPGSTAWDEGTAMVHEQIARSYEDFPGYAHPDRVLAIALALGLDGKPRDFRAVYDVMLNCYIVEACSIGDSYDKARDSALTKAWNRCVRTFRGTNCATPGVCLPRDTAYCQGNVAVWQWLEQTLAADRSNQQADLAVQFLSAGTYDGTNPYHRRLVQEYLLYPAAPTPTS